MILANCIVYFLINNSLLSAEINDQNIALPGGFEPPTFRLTAERANQLRHGSCVLCIIHVLVQTHVAQITVKRKQVVKTPTVGFEPTTFGLEVQRASPLRHAGLTFTAVFTYLTSYDYIYLGKIYLATSNIG